MVLRAGGFLRGEVVSPVQILKAEQGDWYRNISLGQFAIQQSRW